MNQIERNPLTDEFRGYDVHPDDRKVLDRIAARFSHADADTGCIFVTGATTQEGRPKVFAGWHTQVARVIVALRDGLPLHQSDRWHARHVGCHDPRCVAPNHLASGTREQNMQDKKRQGTAQRGERGTLAKLTNGKVRDILRDDRSQRAIADDYGVSQSTISALKQGLTWTDLWDEWQAECAQEVSA